MKRNLMSNWERKMVAATVAMTFVFCLAAQGEQVMVKHPVTRFDRKVLTKQHHLRLVSQFEGRSAEALRDMFVKEKRDSIARARHFESAASSCVSLWKITGEERYRDLGVAVYRAALGDLVTASDEFLQRHITDKGSIEHKNDYDRGLVSTTDLYALRDATEHFAMLYYLTREMKYAHKAAILLARFAEQFPKWPVYYPTRSDLSTLKAKGMIGHMGRWYDLKIYPQKGPGMNLNSDATGPWAIWYYEDIEAAMPLARAYDLIYDSGEMQKLNALKSIEQMLRDNVAFQKAFGETFSNMDAVQKIAILTYAEILGEPEWFHEVVWWLKSICKTQFYADGWWHEGSTAYHSQIYWRLPVLCRRFLQDYSDPPGFVSKLDGTRFDNLDMLSVMSRPFARADAVLRRLCQPNGLVQVLNDTHFGQRFHGPTIKEAQSELFGCRGHAILGTGKGKNNMVQASLSFGGSHGHDHADALNLILFAKGKELISETTYSPMYPNTTREWHTMTAGHATVVVNELQQTSWAGGTQHAPTRTRQPEDAIPGVPDWPWRWRGHGNVMNDGKLRLFSTDFDRVQVVEADAERRYGSQLPLKRYRRTIALVKISETDSYVVDIFRVKGGKTHDYMLHSCLDFPHTLKTSLPPGEERPGTLYKYLKDLRSMKSDAGWSSTFTLDDGSASLKSFFLPQRKIEVIQGTAPAMRRAGTAPFMAVRHTGNESVFAVVHHPYNDKPLVEKVALLPLTPADDQAVAIQVTMPNRVDTIISTTEESDWPVRTCAGANISMQGRFAHIATGGPGNSWAYLVNGTTLRTANHALTCKPSLEGVLQKTLRIEAGDKCDAFVTSTPLPTDGSLDGHTLMVDLAGALVQSFRIKHIERKDNMTLIHSHDDPGMTITPGLVKLEYFPGWGLHGEAHFRIAGTALAIQ